MLVNVSKLVTAYYTDAPDLGVRAQRVAFGTSGHRGTSLNTSFNENHILAITQAICQYRSQQGTNGPLFLGIDTHPLSIPAAATALEVLAANGVNVMIAEEGEYTPTPAVSHAILTYNAGRKDGLADGIVITPSHNPPQDGGFRYNGTDGGPAASTATGWIEKRANEILESSFDSIKRIPLARALKAPTTHRHDYATAYISDLAAVVDLDAVRGSKLNLGADPLGGAGVRYWRRIAEKYGLNLTVVSEEVDPTFRFMTLDWDGQIRMDPSSSYAMRRLIGMKDRFDLAFGCDTDHDRHGIVTKSVGLMPTNHYLAVAIFYLFQNRPEWSVSVGVGKTLVSSGMIDRIAKKLNRKLIEFPVGFKWFVEGLIGGTLGFAGEESAGATFIRRKGGAWTTDKDGLIPCLLAAEITSKLGADPGQIYKTLTGEFGEPFYDRVEASATPEQKTLLSKLSPEQVKSQELAGEKIENVLTTAPGNGAAIGGLKVSTQNGWFAARPSGTENIYKIYAESFRSAEHLRQILGEAQTIVSDALAGGQKR